MKRLSWKYLAGLLDGEGCLDFQVSKLKSQPHLRFYIRPRVRIALVESCRMLLEFIKNSHGGYIYTRQRNNPVHQNACSWELAGYKPSIPLLRNVVNHLEIKHEQAKFLIWMETHLKGKQISQEVVNVCREEMKLMKRDPHRLSERAQDRVLAML